MLRHTCSLYLTSSQSNVTYIFVYPSQLLFLANSTTINSLITGLPCKCAYPPRLHPWDTVGWLSCSQEPYLWFISAMIMVLYIAPKFPIEHSNIVNIIIKSIMKKEVWEPGVVAHDSNPSSWEAEAGKFLSLRPGWSTKWVPGQPELYRKTLSQKKNKIGKFAEQSRLGNTHRVPALER